MGDAFKAAADAYLRRGLTRGVPSLFVDMRPLADADPAKRDVLLALAESYRDALRAGPGAAFPPLAGGAAGGEAPAPESPQTLVWVLFFLARFYDRLVGGRRRGRGLYVPVGVCRRCARGAPVAVGEARVLLWLWSSGAIGLWGYGAV